MLGAGHTAIVGDIGTGSGVIPVTLAVLEPHLPYLYATDASSDALEVAYLNCHLHHVEHRVRLLQGHLLAPLPEPADILTANLPYVGTDEMTELRPPFCTHAPHQPLFYSAEQY